MFFEVFIYMSIFAERLRQLRKEKDISQKELKR